MAVSNPYGSDRSRLSASPTNLLAAISWALLVTVMLGGYMLLRLLTVGDALSEFEEQFFRAGHAHAGVLAAIGILYSQYLGRTQLTRSAQIRAWAVYLVGVLTMSGGFFVHMLLGAEGESSPGVWMITTGGVVLAAAVLFLSYHLFRNR